MTEAEKQARVCEHLRAAFEILCDMDSAVAQAVKRDVEEAWITASTPLEE